MLRAPARAIKNAVQSAGREVLNIFCEQRRNKGLPTLDDADALRRFVRVGVLFRRQKQKSRRK
jgi:hypothetical protein